MNVYNFIQKREAWDKSMKAPKEENPLALVSRKSSVLTTAAKGKLQDLKRDLRIANQIATQLVTSSEQQPMLTMRNPVIVEVVPEIPIVYIVKLEEVCTPLRLQVEYLEKPKVKEYLTMVCQFRPFDQTNSDGWSKKYTNPTTVVIHSQGATD